MSTAHSLRPPDLYFGPGHQLVEVAANEAYCVSDGCGTWTPLASTPTRFLHVVSSIDNYPLQGERFGLNIAS